MLKIATVRFRGVRVENATNCGITISPGNIRIPAGRYVDNVRCNSDGVYVTPYNVFYRWNYSAVLEPGDVGVFTVCNQREVQMTIFRTCQGCRKTFKTTLSAATAAE